MRNLVGEGGREGGRARGTDAPSIFLYLRVVFILATELKRGR
jgi:hypothetical protein